MKKEQQKTIKDGFTWLPMDKRVDKLGFPLPPRKPELRKPLLWVAIESAQEDFIDDIYLVNSSDEVLEVVISNTGGFQTCDDDILTMSSKGFEYKNVANGDAVKVGEYHQILDSDYVLQLSLTITTKHGVIEITPQAEKGGFKEVVLLWDTKEVGKGVTIKNGKDPVNKSK